MEKSPVDNQDIHPQASRRIETASPPFLDNLLPMGNARP
ncbi:hypothetical protein CSB93_1231 [Pseudomonas paraeruginosa]|uniref:Uncharacterized protein n=1 Tax=Pseudomonas paraeruginosa TaxID=2994495 RepID=A0A2R3IUY5_9PSED|nr:hypothetical protein CSB93_1231 [Pseudomonas paraeruginosa]AWE89407.1 hypothetical protein CSC28_6546 [Pseudomonas paraeruginosa]